METREPQVVCRISHKRNTVAVIDDCRIPVDRGYFNVTVICGTDGAAEPFDFRHHEIAQMCVKCAYTAAHDGLFGYDVGYTVDTAMKVADRYCTVRQRVAF